MRALDALAASVPGRPGVAAQDAALAAANAEIERLRDVDLHDGGPSCPCQKTPEERQQAWKELFEELNAMQPDPGIEGPRRAPGWKGRICWRCELLTLMSGRRVRSVLRVGRTVMWIGVLGPLEVWHDERRLGCCPKR